MPTVFDFLSDPGLLPHGYCLAWSPRLLWTLVAANALIGLSYFSIPVALFYFVRRQQGMKFNSIFLMFGLFILACGTTHFIGILSIWYPAYRLDASVLTVTAVISVATAAILWPLIPQALAFLKKHQVDQQRLIDTNRQLEEHISEVLALQGRLQELSVRDALTGLYNRRHFDEFLAQELLRAADEGYGVSLIMADLDHFKALNDRHGHQAGDRVLAAWSELMRRHMRGSDVLCRYGGEEFVMVMPRIDLAQAIERAEHLRVAFAELYANAISADEPGGITVSLGVAHAEPAGKTPEHLLRDADVALYRAKTFGRNRSASG